jgi:hypothetical protein
MTFPEFLLAAIVAFPLLGLAEFLFPLALDLVRRTSSR